MGGICTALGSRDGRYELPARDLQRRRQSVHGNAGANRKHRETFNHKRRDQSGRVVHDSAADRRQLLRDYQRDPVERFYPKLPIEHIRQMNH
jgi:hypothetical protein